MYNINCDILRWWGILTHHFGGISMGRAIVITSGRGGAGKSLITASLANSLAEVGQKVAIVDFACGFRTHDYIFSSSDKIIFDISDECSGNCKVFESGVAVGLRVTLFPAPNSSAKNLSKDGFLEFAKMLANCFDYVIYDVPEHDETALSMVADICNMLIFVTTTELHSVRAVASLATRFISKDIEQRLIINKIPQTPKELCDFSDLDELVDLSSVQLIGTIPFIENLNLRDVSKITKRHQLYKISQNIARRIMGENVSLIFG